MTVLSVEGMREMANVIEALNEATNSSRFRFPPDIEVDTPNGDRIGKLIWYDYGYRFEATG